MILEQAELVDVTFVAVVSEQVGSIKGDAMSSDPGADIGRGTLMGDGNYKRENTNHKCKKLRVQYIYNS